MPTNFYSKTTHMTTKIFTILLTFLFSISLFSQNPTDANIIGDVKDSKTGEHIPYINITLSNTVIGTTTDQTGHFFLKNLPVDRKSVV